MITAVPARDASLASLETLEGGTLPAPLRLGACAVRTSPDFAMQTIYAEATRPVRADPSVVELGSVSQRPPVSATRPYITRLSGEHEAQLIALLSASISRGGSTGSAPRGH